MAATAVRERNVVLIGGGHAHALVLLDLARRPLPRARVTLVSDCAGAIYSGMVPGVLAGEYAPEEITLDLRALAARAGARLLLSPALRISAAARVLETRDAGLVPFDVASLDVGATVAGLDAPGIREHALATRPVGAFVAALPALLSRARAETGALRAVVVGGGAAGVELACALRARLQREGVPHASVSLLDGAARLLGERGAAVSASVLRALRRRGIAAETGVHVVSASPGRLGLEDGGERPFEILLLATGAAALPLPRASDLPVDARGFLRVGPTLEVPGTPGVFAAGDVASHDTRPDLPRAGLHAVRQAPVLAHNLRARLSGGSLREFHPQRDFLVLLNLGDGRGLGIRFGHALEGRAVLRLKDRIDRGFVARFPRTD